MRCRLPVWSRCLTDGPRARVEELSCFSLARTLKVRDSQDPWESLRYHDMDWGFRKSRIASSDAGFCLGIRVVELGH